MEMIKKQEINDLLKQLEKEDDIEEYYEYIRNRNNN